MNELKNWAIAAGIRAIKTAAQAAIGAIGATAYFTEVSWPVIGSAALLACLVSLLTSVAGLPEVADGANVAKIRKQEAAE